LEVSQQTPVAGRRAALEQKMSASREALEQSAVAAERVQKRAAEFSQAERWAQPARRRPADEQKEQLHSPELVAYEWH
jgi:hypothetical protein